MVRSAIRFFYFSLALDGYEWHDYSACLEASGAGRYLRFWLLVGLGGRPCLLILFAERGP